MHVFKNNLYFIIIFILSFALTINAQIEYVEGERLSIANGLSSNSIWSILQDSRGFLWIGTDNGLNRFDGYNIKIFKNDPGDSTSLSSNSVESIYEDRSGRLWIGTHCGLNQFDPYSETFLRYVHDPNDPNSLSANHVSTINQDKSGSLWIGVWGVSDQASLNKLELSDPVHFGSQADVPIQHGSKFIRYKLHQDIQNSKTSGVRVTCIIVDSSEALWMGTLENGLKKFIPQTGLVEHYRHDPNNPNSIAGDRIRPVTIDSMGFIWIGIWDAGLDRLDPRTGDIFHLQHDPSDAASLAGNNPLFLYADPGGIMWVAIGTVLSGYDSRMNLQTRFSISKKTNVNYYASDGIGFIFQDRSRILWIGTGKNGLVKINRRPRAFVHYQHNPVDPNSLFSNDIQSLYKDRSGNIWITAYGNGISRFDPDAETFKHFQHDLAEPSSLSHNYVASFCEDRFGYIWLGTWAGISRFGPKSETFTNFLNKHLKAQEYKAGSIKHIYEDNSGNLWFGTFNGGLYELTASTLMTKSIDNSNEQSANIIAVDLPPKGVSVTKEFDALFNINRKFYIYKHDPSDSTSISHNSIRGIYEDRSGNLLVTTANGINLLNRKKRTFINITHKAGFSENYGAYERQRFFEDYYGKLWFFSPTLGLCQLNLSKSNAERFKIVDHEFPDDALKNQYDFYATLAPDNSITKNIWISSKYGLHKFDANANNFINHFSEKDGLSTNWAGQIIGDDFGKLWLLSSKGLSVFRENAPHGEQFHLFTAKDGIINSPYGNHLKGAKGEIFWGGANGLYRFFPENMKNNPHIPPVVLTELRIFNKVVQPDTTITHIKHITLAHNENSFSFSFAALDYTRSRLNQYAYFLDGFDKNWKNNGNNTVANYTNIPPGNYVFRVKGSNDSSVWNEQGASVIVTITPPWWHSNWAYVFYFLLTILTLYGWRRFDVKRTQLKNELKLKQFEAEKLKEVDHLKSRFFANISHEFRTPLTLIIDPLREMISDKFKDNLKKQYDVMLRNSQRLLRLINQLLDLSKLESGMMKLRAGNYELIPFLNAVVSLFESHATRQKIHLKFDSTGVDAQFDSPLKLFFDREKLEQIISNLLSNAFKFTAGGGEVMVYLNFTKLPSFTKLPKFSKANKAISISVKDTGVGIQEDYLPFIFDRFSQVNDTQYHEQKGTGIGLALTKELVELHHGEITVKSKLGQGTEFTIRLPMGRDHLNENEIIEDQKFATVEPKHTIEQEDINKYQNIKTTLPRLLRSNSPVSLQNHREILAEET